MSDKNNLELYKDAQGVTEKRLNFGLWFVRNRKKMLGILVIILLLVSMSTWLNTIYNFAYYFFEGAKKDELSVREGIETGLSDRNLLDDRLPKDIRVGEVFAIRSRDKVDFVTRIDNLNLEHYLHFTYSYLVGSEETEIGESFIMPGESKYLVQTAQTLERVSGNVSLNMIDLSWDRVSKHDIPDWNDYLNARTNFTVSNSEFLPAKSSGLSEKIKLNLLTFQIENDTAFNYWDINLNVLLYSRGAVIAVTKYNIEEFMSGELRNVSVTMPGDIGQVTDIQVFPEIDLSRDDIYMKFR